MTGMGFAAGCGCLLIPYIHAVGQERARRGTAESEFLRTSAAWAQAAQDALVDPGAPLSMKKLLSSKGVEDYTEAKVAHTIVEADSHDETVRIFAEHPHLGLLLVTTDLELVAWDPPGRRRFGWRPFGCKVSGLFLGSQHV